MINRTKHIIIGLILMITISPYISTVNAQPKPFASVGSHWNYWIATEYTYGFHNYKVVKDTVLTAPMFETNESKTVTASWIEKKTYSSMHGAEGGSDGYYQGAFAAYREGNASYVWDTRTKKWFKWIDMDAKPGDKWVVPEIISGKGVHDYVEVSFLDTTYIDGKEVPLIYLIPSCTSRYTTKKDFTSRLNMSGYHNIDYLSLNNSPEPSANGFVYTSQGGATEMNFGLICAKVNEEYLATSQLEEYVKNNNKPYYDRGIVDCDSLKAPMVAGSNNISRKTGCLLPSHPEDYILYDFGRKSVSANADFTSSKKKNFPVYAPTIHLAATDTIKIPVVVHVVHNPATPEEKIEPSQIQKMLDALNVAYTETQIEKVRTPFKDVVGNPYIRFEMARYDPSGNVTNGIVYYETTADYYELPSTGNVKVRYAFKYNPDGTSRNWDHTKYANIFVADLGGFDAKNNVAGFVTNPEYTNQDEFAVYKKWIMEQDPEFWDNWLKTGEAAQLDGLTVDTWYTFGGKSELNPDASFNTAIHELGHYLGLKHVSLNIIQNNDGSIETNDDGFEDTPFTHYNQYARIACGRDVYQCGNLVQSENYMDYSLECACMFTREQSAFMRNFISAVRPHFINSSTGVKDINDNLLKVYPNPAKDYIQISGEFKKVRIINSAGVLVAEHDNNNPLVDISAIKSGIYFVVIDSGNGKAVADKLIIDN